MYRIRYSQICDNSKLHVRTGTPIKGPSNVKYLPDLTPLPIELICNDTGVTSWRVNGTDYALTNLTNGGLPGHNLNGTNILVNGPVNNTEYICVSAMNFAFLTSAPAYLTVAGEYQHIIQCDLFNPKLHIPNIQYLFSKTGFFGYFLIN